MVYHFFKYGLKITCTELDHHPKVVVTLGSEVRTFQRMGLVRCEGDSASNGVRAWDR